MSHNDKVLVCPGGIQTKRSPGTIQDSVHVYYQFVLRRDGNDDDGDGGSSGNPPALALIDHRFSEFKRFREEAVAQTAFPWLALPTLPEPLLPFVGTADEATRRERELRVQCMLFVCANSSDTTTAPLDFLISKLGATTTTTTTSSSSSAAPPALRWVPSSTAAAAQPIQQQQPSASVSSPPLTRPQRFAAHLRNWTLCVEFTEKLAAEVATLRATFEKMQVNSDNTGKSIDAFAQAFSSLKTAAATTATEPSVATTMMTEAHEKQQRELSAVFAHRASEAYPLVIEQTQMILFFVDGARSLACRRRDCWTSIIRDEEIAEEDGVEMDAVRLREIEKLSAPDFEKLHEKSFADFCRTFQLHWAHSLTLFKDALQCAPPQQQ